MARTRTEDSTANAEAGVLEGQTEIPGWAVPDPADQEVAVFSAKTADQYRRKLRPEELVQWAASQITSYEEDDPRMVMEIAAQIVQASTVDEVLGKPETTKGREILDTILEVNAIKFTMSTEPKGCPYFAVLSVRNTKTGTPDVVSVGGWRLVLQLAQLHYMCAQLPASSEYLVDKDAPNAIAPETYPIYFKLGQAPTSSGNTMNFLAPPMS